MRDWGMVQLALYETAIVDMAQVFLPFATDAKGQTLYEKMVERKFCWGQDRTPVAMASAPTILRDCDFRSIDSMHTDFSYTFEQISRLSLWHATLREAAQKERIFIFDATGKHTRDCRC